MVHKPFNEVWEDLKQLKGKVVYTLCYRWRNDIVGFDDYKMLRLSHAPQASGEIKPVSKRTFLMVWEHLLKDGDFVPKDIPAWKIACACIAHLPEVEYSCKEGFIHLYLRPKGSHPFCEVREYKGN